jgi:hypothetical protein
MPYSKDQQTAARIALAAKKNPKLRKNLRGASLSMYEDMSIKELEDFANSPIKK